MQRKKVTGYMKEQREGNKEILEREKRRKK
jgi:hypothetical protein